jgi:Xaa-Pro aminopeptidase
METEFGSFLKFEKLTLCHLDTKLIKKELLSDDEILWLNQYHQKVYELLSPLLDGDHADWLKEKTLPI